MRVPAVIFSCSHFAFSNPSYSLIAVCRSLDCPEAGSRALCLLKHCSLWKSVLTAIWPLWARSVSRGIISPSLISNYGIYVLDYSVELLLCDTAVLHIWLFCCAFLGHTFGLGGVCLGYSLITVEETFAESFTCRCGLVLLHSNGTWDCLFYMTLHLILYSFIIRLRDTAGRLWEINTQTKLCSQIYWFFLHLTKHKPSFSGVNIFY